MASARERLNAKIVTGLVVNATGYVGPIVDVGSYDTFAMQINFTSSTLTGSAYLAFSNDGVNFVNNSSAVSIPGTQSALLVTTLSTGTALTCCYNYVRLYIVRTAGSGTIDVWLEAKGI